MLMANDVAQEFARTEGWRTFDSARDLVVAIDRYMTSKGLSASKIDRLDVASHVLEIQAQKVATPEEAQWAGDQSQGIGNPADELAMRRMAELALAAQIQQMSMLEYSEFRKQTGLQRDLVSFLGSSE
jgi:hypothetical protein